MFAAARTAVRASTSSASARYSGQATRRGVGAMDGASLRNGALGASIFGFVGGVYYYTITMMTKEADIFAELDMVIDEADRERTDMPSPSGKSTSSNALATKKISGMQVE